jgi:membrane protease YdiL (CAAX protease family)
MIPTMPDLLFVVLFAVAGPLIDCSLFWPAYRRLSESDPAWARRWLWRWGIGNLWWLVAMGAVLWMAYNRSWESFGFRMPAGWRLWVAIGVVLLMAAYQVLAVVTVTRSVEQRTKLREQLGPVAAVLPRTRRELSWFAGVSFTAGFGEEFLFRGYFIWALASWLGWWGAAAVSLACFAIGHLYQGWGGVIRTAMMGGLFTLVVGVLDSLWPAIALHTLVDLGGGALGYVALKRDDA